MFKKSNRCLLFIFSLLFIVFSCQAPMIDSILISEEEVLQENSVQSRAALFNGKGRIAFSSDGNEHDTDDWGATALSLAILAKAGLQDKVVHYDYSDHIWGSANGWQDQMYKSAYVTAGKLGFDQSVFYDDTMNLNAAVNNLAKVINESSESNPLYLICAGPMEVPWRGLNAAQASKRKYVTCISHSTWNDNHAKKDHNGHNFNDLGILGAKLIHIKDQNPGLGKQSSMNNWAWLKNYGAAYTWVYDRIDAVHRTGDASDGGMVFYLLTENQDANTGTLKNWFAQQDNKPTVTPEPTATPNPGTGGYQDKNGLVIMEAENTTSSLGKWIKKKDVGGFTGSGHLEFTGNGINGGTATSPLKYTFSIKQAGNYRLIIRARKRLEGEPGDKCNDGYIKMEGNYTAGTGGAPLNILKANNKFFGGTANGWGWAQQLDVNHTKYSAVYNFQSGQTYTLTVSGRSIRWNIDRIVLFHTSAGIDNAKNTSFEETQGGPTPDPTPTVQPTPTAKPTLAPTVQPTPTAKPTLAPTVQPTPTTKPTLAPTVNPNGRVTVNYIVSNQWNNGFTAAMTLANDTNNAITNWEITFSFTGDQKITNGWGGKVTQWGKNVTVTPEAWNNTIQPNGMVDIGFNAGFSGTNTKPINIKVTYRGSSNPDPTVKPTASPSPVPTPTVKPTAAPTSTPIPTVKPTATPGNKPEWLKYSGNASWNNGIITLSSSGKFNYGGTTGMVWKVPTDVKKIIIAGGVRVIGTFTIAHNCTIEGQNRYSSVIYGTDESRWADSRNISAIDVSAIKVDGSPTIYVKNLTIKNGFGFMIRGNGKSKIHVDRCDFIDTRSGGGNHSDGFVGGDGSSVSNSYFSTGDDAIKVYWGNTTYTNITINMRQNCVPIQLGWGDHGSGAKGTFKNLKITGDNGRNPVDRPVISGANGSYTKTIIIDGAEIKNPNAALVNLNQSGQKLNLTITNADIQVDKFNSTLKGTLNLSICGTSTRKNNYYCK